MQRGLACALSLCVLSVTFPSEGETTGVQENTPLAAELLKNLDFIVCSAVLWWIIWWIELLWWVEKTPCMSNTDSFADVQVPSVNPDFPRVKLEDKRLLWSSNPWKSHSGLILILSWNVIPTREVCEPEMKTESVSRFRTYLFLQLWGRFKLGTNGHMCVGNQQDSGGRSPARIACPTQSSLREHCLLPRRAAGEELVLPVVRLGPSLRDPAIKTRLSLSACFCDRCGT